MCFSTHSKVAHRIGSQILSHCFLPLQIDVQFLPGVAGIPGGRQRWSVPNKDKEALASLERATTIDLIVRV